MCSHTISRVTLWASILITVAAILSALFLDNYAPIIVLWYKAEFCIPLLFYLKRTFPQSMQCAVLTINYAVKRSVWSLTMIKSMTGYGRSQKNIDGRDISVEIKTVNHRYFEFSSRVPRSAAYLEEKLKSLVHGEIARGKTDVFVSIVTVDDISSNVTVNEALAASYLSAVRRLSDSLGIRDDVTVSKLTRFSDIFVVSREPEDEDAVWNAVKQVAQEALKSITQMRIAEGEKLKDDIINRLDILESFTAQVEKKSPQVTAEYRNRLLTKIKEVLENKQIEEDRILTEVAIFAEKTAVDEETVRLRSHIAQLRDILDKNEPMGRKLDFLVQELNRETNTIGSKAQDLEIARIVVEMKSEIEKIREQVQNLE